MTREEAEAKYKEMGLQVKYFDDEPGYLYRFHRHGETRLYCIAGVGFLKVGEDSAYKIVSPGTEIIIHEDELHGGVAGPEGWQYVGGSKAWAS